MAKIVDFAMKYCRMWEEKEEWMKPGYYLSELGNLQIWYPKGHFKKDRQTMEVYLTLNEKFIHIHYTAKQIDLLLKILEFDYLGEL